MTNENMTWLYSFTTRGIKLDLENTKTLLRRLGDPQNDFKSIHVAGTDGKGSICACISSILISSHIRTGLYTSPHIEEFNERITVDGNKISDDEMERMIDIMRPVVKSMEDEGMIPTFFEVTTALAFLHFKKQGVEYAVIEVGLGGRLDSTNVVIPEVSVIGNISMDHQEFLGNTMEEIALEKAGIIKPGVPCVTMNPDPVFKVIERTASERGSKIFRIDPNDILIGNVKAEGTEFLYKEEGYFVSILGSRQANNASMAIEAVSKLKIFGQCVRCNIKKGLKEVRWPCRLERIGDTPFIVDVTHTAAGSSALADDVEAIYGKVDVVIGMLKDKDIRSMSRNLSRISDKAYISELDTERTASIDIMEEAFISDLREVVVCDNIHQAMERAARSVSDNKILITGSFHTAEEALDWLRRTSHGSWTYSQRNTTEGHTQEDRRKV